MEVGQGKAKEIALLERILLILVLSVFQLAK